MQSTKIRFYGGLSTIGGNIAEVRRGNDRVIFDFGRAYNPADTILSAASGREGSAVADLLRLKILPQIDGIYRKNDIKIASYLAMTGLPIAPLNEGGNAADSLNTCIFISHLHLDHMANIDSVPDVPIYMSSESKQLYAQLCAIGEEPVIPLEQIRGLDYEEPVSIGAIKVKLYAVDHDVHGACAIYIEAPDMRIAYSGDIRMHGMYPEKNHKWIKAMRELNLDCLLMEGTTFFPPPETDEPPKLFPQYSEAEVPALVAEKLQAAQGIAFFNFYHRNLDRMANLIEAAKIAGRTIVFEPQTARLAKYFLPQADVLVLDESIGNAEINANPAAYFVQNSFYGILSLLDYNTDGSVYIHTNGIPLGAFDPAFVSMQSLLGTLGVNYELISVSGHAKREAILEIIDGISPKLLIPWHSKAPQEIIPLNPNQKLLLPTIDMWYSKEELFSVLPASTNINYPRLIRVINT